MNGKLRSGCLSTSGLPKSTHLPEFHIGNHQRSQAAPLCQICHARLGRLTRVSICDQSICPANEAFGVARTSRYLVPRILQSAPRLAFTPKQTHTNQAQKLQSFRHVPYSAVVIWLLPGPSLRLASSKFKGSSARAKNTASHHDEPMIAALITEVIAKGKYRAIMANVWTATYAGDFLGCAQIFSGSFRQPSDRIQDPGTRGVSNVAFLLLVIIGKVSQATISPLGEICRVLVPATAKRQKVIE